ncbi:hypothetical protein [Curtobacterium sp. RRHDQ10]|uniref:hypothetical protein n=1 Tax=Curtobacterium phyllosphaerae TaxID=3413379 RepID=UPI003BF08A68
MLVLFFVGGFCSFLTWLQWVIGIDRPPASEHLLKIVGSLVLAAIVPAAVVVIGPRRQDRGLFIVACVLLPLSIVGLGADIPNTIRLANAEHERETSPPTAKERSATPAQLRESSALFWDETLSAANLTRVEPIDDAAGVGPRGESCELRNTHTGYQLLSSFGNVYWGADDDDAALQAAAAYWRTLGYTPTAHAASPATANYASVGFTSHDGPIRRAYLRQGPFGLELFFESICVADPESS